MPKKSTHLIPRTIDLMEVPPVTVPEDATIDEAAALMWDKNIGSVIVVNTSGLMTGIVTEKDIVFSVSKAMTGKGIPVSSVASRTLLKASPREGIVAAVEKMLKGGVRHMPVVDSGGRPLGMISMRDALDVSEPLLKTVLSSPRKRAKA